VAWGDAPHDAPLVSVGVQTGAKSAVAKVQIGFPAVGKLFTDHLSMLRVKGCWMIVSKTYAFQPWTLA
jgi:hypothetical protein